ncbi:FAD-dependent oxidoreductase [Victivallis sp. Marseille-Q1083]|uniref:FAD-dependent oxidoreductase n=1 Tax=Victivallis sp. Marseille-Q1083 TaxID=2717288 RepID=UPI00158C8F04|nr:FAD-dependent oxidoreductase [Victivallis sp. Marseille-Q1083]
MKTIKHPVQYDVVVAGGGVGGITAAVAAARSGARTLLVEEDLVLGGALTDYFVAMLCGQPTRGILLEILNRCISRHALQHGVNWFLPSGWLHAIAAICGRETNLEIMTGARLTGVRGDGGHIDAIEVDCESIRREITAKMFIEATGTGWFAELAGCEIMYGRDARSDFGERHAPAQRDNQVQQVTWMYISQKLPGFPPFDMTRLENVRLGVLPQEDYWFHADPAKAVAANDGIYLHWGCRTECADTRDSVAVGRAQQTALQLMERDHALLRENGYTVTLAPKIGLREVRRVKGLHVLSSEEVMNNQFPDDTVAVGKYELDIWGEEVRCHAPWNGYGIPYRSLVPLRVDNLLLAGRIISGSHIAMSSYRVMPIVGNIGQAAGVAAALAVKHRCSPAALAPRSVRDALTAPPQNQILEP